MANRSVEPAPVDVISPEEAAGRVPSDAVVVVSGLVGSLVPDRTLQALRRRFDRASRPRHLTVIFPVAVGDVFEAPGLDRLAHPDLLKTVIGGSFVYGKRADTGEEPELVRMILSGDVEAYNFSIGTLFGALRESAAHRPGLLTRVGLGTFQDPRQRGGRLNDNTPSRFVTVEELDDHEYLRYELPPVDVALLRASTADEHGNVTMEREVVTGGVFVEALAAHNRGGRVIVQVERLAEGGSLDPRKIAVPGTIVDAVVVAPGEQQATGVAYDPYLSGELWAPARDAPQLEPVEEIILSKTALRLHPGDLVILGFGMPSKLPALEELPPGIRFTVEHGAIGGMPTGGLVFGGAINPEAVVDTPSMFDLIDGGGCDAACLGFAQVDPRGSVNVSRLPNALPGSGGFTDITASTPRLIFCGSFTAGGLKVEREGDRVTIVNEGRFAKFVNEPLELTYNAEASEAQEVAFVTDRCVIERVDGELAVTDVYPGIDVQRDILDRCEFELRT